MIIEQENTSSASSNDFKFITLKKLAYVELAAPSVQNYKTQSKIINQTQTETAIFINEQNSTST